MYIYIYIYIIFGKNNLKAKTYGLFDSLLTPIVLKTVH